MKKLWLLAMLLWCSAVSIRPANAISLSLEPTVQTTTPGGTAAVDLFISGLAAGGAPSLGAFRVEVTFDPAILSLNSVLFGGLLGAPDTDFDPFFTDSFETDIFVDTALPGAVLLDEFSFLFDFELDALQPDAFTLASLSFTGGGLGTSALGFGLVDLSDAVGFSITPALQTAAVNVSVVPEPGTLLLMGSGIAGLIGLRRRKKRMGALG